MKITVTEFASMVHQDLDEFAAYYMRKNITHADDYPDRLSDEDFLDIFWDWMISKMGYYK